MSQKRALFKKEFMIGLKMGLPICFGYIPVSFTYGSFTAANKIPAFISSLISMTNLTSSGQFAATKLMIASAAVIEIIVITLIINSRYLLMSLSLSQRVAPDTPMWQKAIFAFGVTDEIFAISSLRSSYITFPFMIGVIITPLIGWTGGTVLGSLANNLLTPEIISAMGIALYAMFISIVIPKAKAEKRVLIVCILSIVLSVILYYVPIFNFISDGWAIIIVAVTGASAGALFMPVDDDKSTSADNTEKRGDI